MSGWLVVTPARDEAARLPALAASLAAQTVAAVALWVVVDDGSTDGTGACVDWAALPFPATVVTRPPGGGGLAGGGAFAAWYAGTDHGLALVPDAARVLKLDADVVLDPTYVEALLAADQAIGLLGGVFDQPGERSAPHHVRGPLKAYSRPAFALVRALPAAVGHDVMDEVVLRRAGLGVAQVPSAKARVTRLTTSSEGLLRGRVRNGKVTRWTGYHPVMVVLRLGAYALRRPPIVGAFALAWGYATAGPSPYPAALRCEHRRQQRARLLARARRPLGRPSSSASSSPASSPPDPSSPDPSSRTSSSRTSS